jgi:predicted small secreted protein
MKKLLFIMMITSLTTLSGCETFDPYTGEEKTSNTAKGAGIGAGARRPASVQLRAAALAITWIPRKPSSGRPCALPASASNAKVTTSI